ncbi:MAG: MucR family transcriptional regulator [Proteobacteria bacterium]|nr:MucR family transcriptional regulator [Pseudomonadota bacterium]
MEKSSNTIELTAQIVSAYVTRADVPRADLAQLIAEVNGALIAAADGKLPAGVGAITPMKSTIRKSIFPDYIICLEDGKRFKSLKRHLRVKYNLTPEQYRAKWGLPPDYPMVAPKYAEKRSKLAKSIGLGRKPKKKAK